MFKQPRKFPILARTNLLPGGSFLRQIFYCKIFYCKKKNPFYLLADAVLVKIKPKSNGRLIKKVRGSNEGVERLHLKQKQQKNTLCKLRFAPVTCTNYSVTILTRKWESIFKVFLFGSPFHFIQVY